MSNFSNIPTYYHRWLPSTKKWWNYSLRWPPLGSEIIPLSPALCREVFLMLETVCRNHCTMGWPWDGRHRIISSTPIRWDGAHLSSAGVRKNSSATRTPPPTLPSYLIFGGPKWPYIPFGSTISLVAPSSINGFFQAPATIIKTPPSGYLWAGGMSCWKVTGVNPKWPLSVSS